MSSHNSWCRLPMLLQFICFVLLHPYSAWDCPHIFNLFYCLLSKRNACLLLTLLFVHKINLISTVIEACEIKYEEYTVLWIRTWVVWKSRAHILIAKFFFLNFNRRFISFPTIWLFACIQGFFTSWFLIARFT